MKSFNKGLLTALTGMSAMFAVSVQAAPVTIGGVVFDPNSPFNFQASSANFAENFTGTLAGKNLVISAYGKIDTMNVTENQASFCPGCELTFVAGAYTQDPTYSPNASGSHEFTGGFVNIYVDNPGNFDILNSTTAGDGTLWLGLKWHSIFGIDSTIEGANTSLVVSFTGAGATGQGLLDVTGGLAADHFDTNSRFGGADIEFQNSFTNGSGYKFGSGNFFGKTKFDVPEPFTLGLFAIGLLGLGFSRKRMA